MKDQHIDRMNEEISDEQIQRMEPCELMLFELHQDCTAISFLEFEHDTFNWLIKYGEQFKKVYLDRFTH